MIAKAKDGHCTIVLTIQCSDGYCCDGGASRTRAHPAEGGDNSWDSTTHSYTLGRCKHAPSDDVTDTGLHSSRDRTYRFQGFYCCLSGEKGGNKPATGPTALKPTTPSSAGATRGVKATPATVAATPMATVVITRSQRGDARL